jgi:hypothetical protein
MIKNATLIKFVKAKKGYKAFDVTYTDPTRLKSEFRGVIKERIVMPLECTFHVFFKEGHGKIIRGKVDLGFYNMAYAIKQGDTYGVIL